MATSGLMIFDKECLQQILLDVKIFLVIEFQTLIIDPVTSIKLSANQKCILASSLDSSIRLFDRDNGQLLNEYKGHVNNDYKLISCMDKTASYAISGSEDGKIYFWNVVGVRMIVLFRVIII